MKMCHDRHVKIFSTHFNRFDTALHGENIGIGVNDFDGLGKLKVDRVDAGDICAVVGLDNFEIGGTIGTATANPSGGTSPYTYSWNTIPIQTTQTAINLAAGTYTVSITPTYCEPICDAFRIKFLSAGTFISVNEPS